MKYFLTLSIFALNMLLASVIQAGEITGFSWSSGIASVGVQPIVPPVSPNNNDVVGVSPNLVFIPQKAYVGIGPVDIEFTVTNSGGVTEYHFQEGVHNGTGIPWTDYHMQLGFGMGTAFVPSTSGDGLDFDFPEQNSPVSMGPFTTIVVAEDSIDAYNGVVPPSMYVGYLHFHIDVPDGITAFTIRQYPTIDVPEPSGLLLAGMSIMGLLQYGRSLGKFRQ
jgi:hypothetical protein